MLKDILRHDKGCGTENQKCVSSWIEHSFHICLPSGSHFNQVGAFGVSTIELWYSRAFLVKASITSLEGPQPALLQAPTSMKYWVSGRRFSSLAEYSWLVTWTRCAAASLSCAAQYRICKYPRGVIFYCDRALCMKNSFPWALFPW